MGSIVCPLSDGFVFQSWLRFSIMGKDLFSQKTRLVSNQPISNASDYFLVWQFDITICTRQNNTNDALISDLALLRRLTDRVSDDIIILGYFICVHGLKERPCHLVALWEKNERIIKWGLSYYNENRWFYFLRQFFSYATHNQSHKLVLTWSPSLINMDIKFDDCTQATKIIIFCSHSTLSWAKPQDNRLQCIDERYRQKHYDINKQNVLFGHYESVQHNLRSTRERN